MSSEFVMALAQTAFLIGTSFLIIKVVKNRNSLKDFDKIGFFNMHWYVTFSLCPL